MLETRLHELRHQLLDAARHLAGAKVLAARLYGVGPVTALAMRCPGVSGRDPIGSSPERTGDQMVGSKNPKRYSPEFKEEAVKMVVDLSRPIAQVARELGVEAIRLSDSG